MEGKEEKDNQIDSETQVQGIGNRLMLQNLGGPILRPVGSNRSATVGSVWLSHSCCVPLQGFYLNMTWPWSPDKDGMGP